MRTFNIFALLSTVLSGIGFAHAAEKIEGSVLSFDLKAGTLLLMSDDVIYNLPHDFAYSGFDIGDDVVVIYNMLDDEPIVESVSAAQ